MEFPSSRVDLRFVATENRIIATAGTAQFPWHPTFKAKFPDPIP